MNPILCIDIETCSAAPIKVTGADAYAAHESTRVHCVVLAFATRAEQDVVRWFPGDEVPARAVRHIVSGGLLLAHNASFEASIFEYVLVHHGWPVPKPEQWLDTALIAASLNLPRSLEGLGAVIKANVQKDKEGHDLMMSVATAKPAGHGRYTYPDVAPETLKRLTDYCETDVLSTLACWWRLPAAPITERLLMRVDRRINQRGVCVDLELVGKIKQLARQRTEQLARLTFDTTCDLVSLSHVPALKRWLVDCGVELPTTKRKDRTSGEIIESESTDRSAVAALLAKPDLPPNVRTVLEARVEASRVTSLAKVDKIPRMIGPDGRLRNSLLYSEAHTGRWSSRGVQLHNLPKVPKPFRAVAEKFSAAVRAGDLDAASAVWPVLEGLSFLLRSVFVAAPGHELIGADYSGIEARGIAWLAEQEDALEALSDPMRDIYVEDARAVGSDNRDLGKECRLGLGYGMAALKFMGAAAKRGVFLAPKEARRIVRLWRKNNPKIVQFWSDLDSAAAHAVISPGDVIMVGRLTVYATPSCLTIVLPSGRELRYWRPSRREVMRRIELIDENDAIVTKEVPMVELRFFTAKRGDMEPDSTYGGKLAENVTQAVCRDLLGEALIRLEDAGYPIVVHVHDAAASEVKIGQGSVEEFGQIMSVAPPWADGFPIKTEGYRSRHFKG